jgi:PAS domain S-box-containing protein
MAAGNEMKALLLALSNARARVAESASSPEQQRLIGPILAEIDRGIAAVEPNHGASAPLTPLDGTTAPILELEVEALRREVERLRALAQQDRGQLEPVLTAVLTSSPHGILVCDAQGKIFLQNRSAERIWAGSATTDDVAGWGQYRAFHADGRPYEAGDWSMARSLSRGEVINAEEVHFQRFDGTHGILLGSAAPICDAGGAVTGAISTFADITHFKQLERDLRVRDAWLSTTLRSIADGVIATDDHGKVEFMNAVAERVTGWTIDEAKGRDIGELFHVVDAATRAPIEGLAARVLRDGAPVELSNAALVRHRIVRDGAFHDRGALFEHDEIHVDQSGAPIRNEAGDPLGVVLVFRDVTEKRRAEERRRFLAEASFKLASLTLDYEGTLASVAKLAVPRVADWCLVDLAEADGSCSRAAVAHVDPARSVMALALSQRRAPEARALAELSRALRGDPNDYTAEVIHQMIEAASDPAYAELLSALTASAPAFGASGGSGGPGAASRPEAAAISVPLRARDRAIGVLTFVSAESGRSFGPDDAALARQLGNTAALALDNARLYREAQRVNRVKDEFLATLSHELRTPLNAILGWARLLRVGKLDEGARGRALETIERNASAQAQLIEDLLDVSRIISGKFQVDVRPVDLPAVTEAALDAVRLAAEVKNIDLVARIERVPELAGDPTRLQQVVWNLLSNAIKFTQRGGRVEVRVGVADSHVEIVISDNGEGIRKDFLPYVFDRFRQADGTTTRAHSGLGLGLAIVRHLVELHGGSVRAESDGEGKGAVFSVWLPVAAVRPKPEVEPRPGAALPLIADHALPLAGLRVLVVDDEADARELVAAVLTESGARVVAVGSVPEAILAVERHRPDVLVSDIGMPTEDGYSLMRRLRAMEKTVGRIPAAALTAYATVQDRTRALLAGYSSHLPKPIEPAELTAVVANLAGRPARG